MASFIKGLKKSSPPFEKKGVLGALKDGYYKYLWWGISRGGGQFDFFAMGKHGQFIYVALHKNLIIVRNGESFGKSRRQWLEGFRAFADAL